MSAVPLQNQMLRGNGTVTNFEAVESYFLPRTFTAVFSKKHIQAAEIELTVRAGLDPDKCYGYFPDTEGIDNNLPASYEFAHKYSRLTLLGKSFGFSFLRLSLVQQEPLQPSLHIDNNATSALCFDTKVDIPPVYAWRALVNLSHHDRSISYSNQAAASAPLVTNDGVIYRQPHPSSLRTHVLPSREGSFVYGMVFCASRVLHGGNDTNTGHFVASYGYEEPA